MLRVDCLPPETGRLLDTLAVWPEMESFTLVGGTALALSWGHRRSEDLDFAVPALDLPRSVCRAVLDRLAATGWRVDDISDPTARLYHENEGADLADSQQDWLCRFDGAGTAVKLTFFAEFMPGKQAPYRLPPLRRRHVAVMPPEGLLVLKSQLLLRRTTLRDLFDLWAFLERGATIDAILAAARDEDRYCSYERLRARLLPPKVPLTDPGLDCLVEEGPRDLPAIKAALQVHLDAYEARLAAAMMLGDDGENAALP